MLCTAQPSSLSSVSSVRPERAARFVTADFDRSRYCSFVSAMMGERLETLVEPRSSLASSGIFTRAEMSESSALSERSRLLSAVQSARAEMSVTPRPLRSSSVTSDLKSTPPRERSLTSTVASSENTVQFGSFSWSAFSSVSVISRSRMSSVVRPERLYSGSRLSTGLPFR